MYLLWKRKCERYLSKPFLSRNRRQIFRARFGCGFSGRPSALSKVEARQKTGLRHCFYVPSLRQIRPIIDLNSISASASPERRSNQSPDTLYTESQQSTSTAPLPNFPRFCTERKNEMTAGMKTCWFCNSNIQTTLISRLPHLSRTWAQSSPAPPQQLPHSRRSQHRTT